MSAPSEGAASPSPCACTNISLMQLFHELKQKFPGVPDHVVSNTIELYCHDKQACETHLHSEAKASLTHAYHASSSAAARQLNELKVDAPLRCKNQPIVKHEISRPTAVTAITCQVPQVATITTKSDKTQIESNKNSPHNNLVEAKNSVNISRFQETQTSCGNASSPVTINIDNCVAKYNSESSSDHELTNDGTKDEPLKTGPETETEIKSERQQTESTNYQILKSSKIKSNLNERLEKPKEKKTISKKNETSSNQPLQEKPKRPCTLEFMKPNPDVAFKQHPNLSESEPCRTVSPSLSAHKEEAQHSKDVPSSGYWPERGYPVNLSVKVNCHMDLGRGYSDPWLEDFDSPHTITSVNLTVCTPTSSMASPIREDREGREEDSFEGHVLVTVSPSTTRPPRRRAPMPPQPPPPQPSPLETHQARPSTEQTREPSLIERQRARLKLLQDAVAAERTRLAQLVRETAVLEAPPPHPSTTRKLREEVHQLREACATLAKHFEISSSAPDTDNADFYSNIYTGQRPSNVGRPAGGEARRPARPAPPPPPPQAPPADAPWQCHVCTFRNYPELTNCEQCDMPRIFVGTSTAPPPSAIDVV
ncbi:TGF-beta-activated kinase 1 and MAP3K7-binding protein 2 [Eumeta japonica]|uniref:TGF-beta-activated kinase 1 and MAP3K7-binding protein 2 n=1 Tax=Eumeta variegata TaxID=151549 RepID=A0A4C1U7U9_EUMVA|nr:TGF-beta-activated kinase 1 and MAP3K7-binding protein 2 [Eumeta japonica]